MKSCNGAATRSPVGANNMHIALIVTYCDIHIMMQHEMNVEDKEYI